VNGRFGSIAAGHVGPKRSGRCVKLYCCKLRTRQASTGACVKHCFDALHIEIAHFHRGACVKHYCSSTAASIAKAYDTALPAQEQEAVRRHLAFILPKLKEPNTLIAPVQAALMAVQSRPVVKQLHEHAVARVIGAVLLALVIAGLTKLLGWN
jgi:hypothetical protein